MNVAIKLTFAYGVKENVFLHRNRFGAHWVWYESGALRLAKPGDFASQDSVTIAYGELPTPQ